MNFNRKKTQSSVQPVLHTTSATKLSYDLRRKNMFGYEYVAARKWYIWTLATCTVFLLIINLYTTMRDRIHRAITQTIHTNLISWIVL